MTSKHYSNVAFLLSVFAFFIPFTFVYAEILSESSSTGSNTANGGTTLTVNAPSSVTPGDFLLASITYDNGASTTVTAPTGWALIQTTNNALKVGIATYYKFAGAAEPASYTWTLSLAGTAVGGIVKYSGLDSANPIDTTSSATGHSQTASAPSVVTSMANEKVVAVFGIEDNRTFSTPTGFTEKFDFSNPGNNGPATAFSEITAVTPGTVATSTSSVGNPNRRWVAQHIVLRPAPPVGTLRVTKSVVNNNFGTSTASAFSFQINGGSPIAFSTNGANDMLLSPGTYSVTEVPANGYATIYSNCSSAVVTNGGTVTCAITNDDIPGVLLTVRKVIEGGTAIPSDFTLYVNSTTVQSGQQNFFPSGVYAISETGPTGYRSVISGDCDLNGNITLGSNGAKTCTTTSYALENTLALCTDEIDNDVDSVIDLYDSDCDLFIPRLNVVSTVTNDNGGTYDGDISQMDFIVPNPTNPLPGTVLQNTAYPNRYRTPSGPPITLKLNPGSYNLVWFYKGGYPNLIAEYALTHDCSGTIAEGEVRTCTLAFDDIAPMINVVKQVVNNNGGTAAPSDFIMNVTGTNVSNSSFSGDNAGTLVTLEPGPYSVSETNTFGYVQTIANDCSGVISLGETKNCVFTNSELPIVENTLDACTDGIDNDEDTITDLFDSDCEPFIPRLTVLSSAVNDNGGTYDGDISQMDFIVPNPTNPLPGTVLQNTAYPNRYRTPSGPPITLKLNPGSYNLVYWYKGGYPDLSGEYALSQSADCAATIAPGESRVCSLTFNDKAPQLTVIKNVVNNGSGTALSSDFTMTVTGTNVSTTSFAGSSDGVLVTLDPGSYSVSEINSGYYIQVASDDCLGTIGLGDSKTCVFTNSDVELAENTLSLCTDGIDNDQDTIFDLYDPDCDIFIPRLTVLSTVINDDGGVYDGSLSNIDLIVPNPTNPLPGTALQNTSYSNRHRTSGPPVTLKLNPGAYNLVWWFKAGYPDLNGEYAISQSADCAATIAPGENRTCTLTFNDKASQLTIIKNVVNDNGGTAVSSDFTMNVTGTNVSNSSFEGNNSGVTVTMHPGAFAVTESGPSGYTLLTGTDCSGTINLGESRTCVITNTDIPPALILVKQVINDNGGVAATSDWTLTANGPTSISGAGFVTSETTNSFTAGTYTLSESGGPSGYTASGWSCSGDITNIGNSITLGIGQNSTCTITNDDN